MEYYYFGGICGHPLACCRIFDQSRGKDRRGTPLCGGMLITKLAKSFEVFQKREAMILTVERGKAFSPLLFKRENIVVDNGGGNYSIPNDDPRE